MTFSPPSKGRQFLAGSGVGYRLAQSISNRAPPAFEKARVPFSLSLLVLQRSVRCLAAPQGERHPSARTYRLWRMAFGHGLLLACANKKIAAQPYVVCLSSAYVRAKPPVFSKRKKSSPPSPRPMAERIKLVVKPQWVYE